MEHWEKASTKDFLSEMNQCKPKNQNKTNKKKQLVVHELCYFCLIYINYFIRRGKPYYAMLSWWKYRSSHVHCKGSIITWPMSKKAHSWLTSSVYIRVSGISSQNLLYFNPTLFKKINLSLWLSIFNRGACYSTYSGSQFHQFWDEAEESAFLTSLQVILMHVICVYTLKNPCIRASGIILKI